MANAKNGAGKRDAMEYGLYLKKPDGAAFRVPRKEYDEAAEAAADPLAWGALAGTLFTLVTIGFTVFFQYRFGGGLKPTAEAVARFAVSAEALDRSLWPLVTANFLHDGLSHLLSNMFAVALFGYLLARGLGFLRTVVLYLVAGVASTAFGFVTVSATGATYLLGASGATYALVISGLLVTPSPTGRFFSWRLLIGLATILFIPAVQSKAYSEGMVAHGAHLAGAVVGVLLFLVLVEHYYRDLYRWSAVLFVLVLVAVGLLTSHAFSLAKLYKAGALDGPWPSIAKQAVAWIVGSGVAGLALLGRIMHTARVVDSARAEEAFRVALDTLCEEEGEQENRSLDDVIADLHARYRTVYATRLLDKAFGNAGQAWEVAPLMVTCPLCGNEATVPDIGDQTCHRCDWRFTIDEGGQVTAGHPATTSCPACKKEFAIRCGGPVACPDCTWAFTVDGSGAVIEGKPETVTCDVCRRQFNVPATGRYSCPQCGKSYREPAPKEAPEPPTSVELETQASVPESAVGEPQAVLPEEA